MTLLRDLIRIPESVSEGDFVVRAAEGADLDSYVVTEQLRESFIEALKTVEHALATGRSQAKFLHGSFGSGKSHFMAVLREVLQHNRGVRAVAGLDEVAAGTDRWLPGKKILALTFHMLDAKSVEQAVLEGYLNQVAALHPDAPPAGGAPLGRVCWRARQRSAVGWATRGSSRLWVKSTVDLARREAGWRRGWRGRRAGPRRPTPRRRRPPGHARTRRSGQRADDDVLHRRGAGRRISGPGHRPGGDHAARQRPRLRRDGAVPRRADPVAVHQDHRPHLRQHRGREAQQAGRVRGRRPAAADRVVRGPTAQPGGVPRPAGRRHRAGGAWRT